MNAELEVACEFEARQTPQIGKTVKIKQLKWYSPREEEYLSTNEIPQVLYRIRKVAPFVYGAFFYHGYADEDRDGPIVMSDNVEHCKSVSQAHWETYVKQNFLEI